MSFEDPEFPILDEDEDEDGLAGFVSPDRTRTSSFFANSHNFTIKGGHFAIHNHISAEQAAPRGRPKAFREIDWCDIFLEDKLDVVRARVAASRRRSVLRNIYSAKIEGQHNPDKTVVIYEGDGAKQTWYEDVSKYLRVRHPRVLQLFGLSYSAGMFAAIFHHQDLVSIERVIEVYSHEPITEIYFYNFLHQEFLCHAPELARMLQVETLTTWDDCSLWLNTAGQLYIELGRREQFCHRHSYLAHSSWSSWNIRHPRLVASTDLIPAHQVIEIVENLTLQGFYRGCDMLEQCFHPTLEKGTSAKIRPGSVIGLHLPRHERLTADEIHLSLSSEYTSRDVKEVAFLNEGFIVSIRNQGSMMENGWIRAKIPRYTGTGKAKSLRNHLIMDTYPTRELFVSQAVYIFNHTQNHSPSNFYFMVNSIHIGFVFMPTRKRIQLRGRASLFLPLAKDFLSPDGTQLQYSTLAPYWSLHPSGHPPLAPEHAATLGLPSVETKIWIRGSFYSLEFYEDIAQFHRLKGFDPTSQDVAREMGVPIIPSS
ncbi:hypothetical protein R3P38DRAFT_3252914 [Favolaschia claudopus]|uniref:Uncharacterized protein n=1 Tax=Favolaschia claudopus TaxID=2862362 RepID=A0AAW0E233_9AGAR